jgi:cytochrome P450
LKAISFIFNHTDVFQKPATTRGELGRILGEGILIAEGTAHRNQRRVLNPAFGPGQIRDMSGIFLDKANEVRTSQWPQNGC